MHYMTRRWLLLVDDENDERNKSKGVVRKGRQVESTYDNAIQRLMREVLKDIITETE